MDSKGIYKLDEVKNNINITIQRSMYENDEEKWNIVNETKRILQFDEPHPRKELYIYQIKICVK